MLVAFQVEDWNRDFSPWEALAVFGTEAFAGQGKRTLKWLVEEGVPYIDIFSGIECCSGSLWFKDWDIYMREHTLKRKCSVYLSLGGKENKLTLSISEINRTDSTEWTVKLSEFFFYSMDVFHHQLNDINRFIGVPANKEFSCCLYDTEDGRCSVQELLDSLEHKLLAKTLRTIDLLEMNGPLLREPYSKPLEDRIFELRSKQGSDITRVLYFFIVGKKAVLTNGFIKKSQDQQDAGRI